MVTFNAQSPIFQSFSQSLSNAFNRASKAASRAGVSGDFTQSLSQLGKDLKPNQLEKLINNGDFQLSMRNLAQRFAMPENLDSKYLLGQSGEKLETLSIKHFQNGKDDNKYVPYLCYLNLKYDTGFSSEALNNVSPSPARILNLSIGTMFSLIEQGSSDLQEELEILSRLSSKELEEFSSHERNSDQVDKIKSDPEFQALIAQVPALLMENYSKFDGKIAELMFKSSCDSDLIVALASKALFDHLDKTMQENPGDIQALRNAFALKDTSS